MSSPIVEQEFEIGLSDTAKATMSAAITALVKASLITAYSTSATYAVGDFVYYSGDGKIYKCVTAITTAEAWTSAHWSEATLNDVISAVNAAVSTVNGKANVDGNYPTMTVGKSETAKNLEPYSDDSGAEQSNPFISQGTGTDNNTAIVATGNFAQLREKQGNTLPVIQLADTAEYDAEDDSPNSVITKNFSSQLSVIGHKYLVFFALSVGDATKITNVRVRYPFISEYRVCSTSKTTYYFIGTADSANPLGMQLLKLSEATGATYSYTNVKIFDITSWPADVITDLTANPSHFSWYYNGSLAYNAGSLENANGVKLVCTHRNLFAGDSESNPQYIGHYYVNPDGSKSADNNYNAFRVLVIPNKPLHLYRNGSQLATAAIWRFVDKDFNFVGVNASAYSSTYGIYTPPANAQYVEFSLPENVVFDVSLYYTTAEGGEGYDQHYEYKEPTVIDTGSEVLRSAGNAHDVKLPDGTIQRNVGVVDLSTLSFTYDSSRNYMRATVSDMKVMPDAANNIPNLTSKYEAIVSMDGGGYASLNSDYISVPRATRDIVVHATSASDTPTGTLHYELATPTTEEGTAFPDNIDIDDYGMMYWLDENDELVGIPQGAKFFYPFNYAGSLDDLYHYVGGDMQKIIRTYSTDAEELAENPDINKNWDTAPTQNSVKPVTSGGIFEADRQLKDALGGMLRQMLATKASLSQKNTDVVDLGDQTWYKDEYGFVTTITGKAHTENVLMSSADYAYQSAMTSDMTFACSTANSNLWVRNDSFGNDIPAFKAAMKGALFAYEKAE